MGQNQDLIQIQMQNHFAVFFLSFGLQIVCQFENEKFTLTLSFIIIIILGVHFCHLSSDFDCIFDSNYAFQHEN